MAVIRKAENTRMSVQRFFSIYERKKRFLTTKKKMDILRPQHANHQSRQVVKQVSIDKV
jgi:hypothetical protein